MIKDKTLQAFLDELASRASTPGGGSAAAVSGAMGAALISMVAHFTLGKKGYEQVQERAAELLRAAESLRARLTEFIRLDVEAFDRVMAAYGMSRQTEAEQAARGAAIQTALQGAAEVPLACAQACREVIELCRPMAEIGNRNVISDVGVAVLAAEAALRSAALNVHVNLGAIKDPAIAGDLRRRIESIVSGSREATEQVHALVSSKL